MKKLFPLFLVLIFLSACAPSSPINNDTADEPAQEEQLPDPEVLAAQQRLEFVENYLENMSADEKVGQLFFARCPEVGGSTDAAEYNLGGYILFGRDFKDKTANEIVQAIYSYQDAAKTPMLIGVDEEGGSVVRVSSNRNICSQSFLSPQQLFSDNGMEGISIDTLEKSRLLLALGINVNLAPVADVSESPDDFIYSRTFGQSAESTASYVECVVDVMNKAGIGSVLKHFPGYGSNADTHTGSATDNRELSQFESSDFLPFKSGIASGADAILVSHNMVKAFDASLPASLSPSVHDVIRNELGFEGVIMTDDIDMQAISDAEFEHPAAVMAILAGNSMVISSTYKTDIPAVIDAVNDGTISEDSLNSAVRHVLLWKYDLGLIG